jgi:hypothetical protein
VCGDLLVSASTWDGGTVVSHHEMDAVLSLDVEVRVRVLSDGAPMVDGVDVVIVTANGTVQADLVAGEFLAQVRVPEDAAYGELVTVQAVGVGGLVLGENRTFVQGQGVEVTVDATPELLPGPDVPAWTVAVVLAVAALAVAAVLVDARRRRAR